MRFLKMNENENVMHLTLKSSEQFNVLTKSRKMQALEV